MTGANGHPAARGLAGILRRIGAGAYDALLVTGLLMAASFLVTITTRHEGPQAGLAPTPYRPLLSLLALLVIYGYYGLSWTRVGETLGMKAWGLRLVDAAGRRIGWARALLRLCLAFPLWLAPAAALLAFMSRTLPGPAAVLCAVPLLVSLGFAWGDGVSLHDRLSGTRVLRVPRDAPPPAAA